jgi:hypothetical protein
VRLQGKTDPMITNTRKNSIAVSPVVTVLVLLAVMLLSACATTSTASPEDIVKERAQARWDALLDGDFATAYSYFSPGYRSTITVVDFEIGVRMRKVQYRTAEYLGHSCENDVCTVQIKVGYLVARPVPGLDNWESESMLSEQWINSDGEWWFLPQK